MSTTDTEPCCEHAKCPGGALCCCQACDECTTTGSCARHTTWRDQTTDTERDERLREAMGYVEGSRTMLHPPPMQRAFATLGDEIARLDAVVTAVRGLHQPVPYGSPETRAAAPWVPENVCSHCLAENDGCVAYPCPTVRALDGSAR